MDETVGHECATCHAPVEADVWAIGRHHCPPCDKRHEEEWREETRLWIKTHAVSYRVDGEPPNVTHVKAIRELFPKEPKRRKPARVQQEASSDLLGIEEEKT